MTEIRNAATVVITRDSEESLQVLMLRRHGSHEFMAHAWVFPGGSLDERDCGPESADVVAGVDPARAAQTLGGDIDPQTALGLYVAALRETFEEAGLLLARRPGEEQSISLEDPSVHTHFESLRKDIDDQQIGLAELCLQENLVLQAQRLTYLAHWITPDFESRRYDTRFFVASIPSRQHASHDDKETTHRAWWTPQQAIERYREDEILLAPPTLRILEEMTHFSSHAEFVEELRRRPRPPAILPHPITLESGELALALPGDPAYPDGNLPSYPIDGVTRMVRRDGQWFSVPPESATR